MKFFNKGALHLETIIILGLLLIVLVWYFRGPLGLVKETTQSIDQQIKQPLLARLEGIDFDQISPEQKNQLDTSAKEHIRLEEAKRYLDKSRLEERSEDRIADLKKALAAAKEAMALRSGDVVNPKAAGLFQQINQETSMIMNSQKLEDLEKNKDSLKQFFEDLKNPALLRSIAESKWFALKYPDRIPEAEQYLENLKKRAQETKEQGYTWLTLALITEETSWIGDVDYAIRILEEIQDKKYDKLARAHAYLLQGNYYFERSGAVRNIPLPLTVEFAGAEQSITDIKKTVVLYSYLLIEGDLKEYRSQLYTPYADVMYQNLQREDLRNYLIYLSIEIRFNGRLRDADADGKIIEFFNIESSEAVLLTRLYKSRYDQIDKILTFTVNSKDYIQRASEGEIDGLSEGYPVWFTIDVRDPLSKRNLCRVYTAPQGVTLQLHEYDIRRVDFAKFYEPNPVGECENYIHIFSDRVEKENAWFLGGDKNNDPETVYVRIEVPYFEKK